MLGAIIGGLGSVAGSIFGGIAENNAANQNWQINLLNYYAQQQERFDRIQEARRLQAQQELGSTDAQGNRSYFDPVKGWTVDLSPETEEMQGLYRQEEMSQLMRDLPRRRQISEANVERQQTEGGLADAILRQYGMLQRTESRDIEALLNGASTQGITEGFDSALEDAMRASLRTGASNSGRVAADIGRERASALEQAFRNNRVQAMGMADEQFGAAQSQLLNTYNALASRAGQMPDAQYNPRNLEGIANQQMGADRSAAGAGNAALMNAFAGQGGRMSPVQANGAIGNAISGAASGLMGAFDMYNNNKREQAALQDYRSMYRGNAGLF